MSRLQLLKTRNEPWTWQARPYIIKGTCNNALKCNGVVTPIHCYDLYNEILVFSIRSRAIHAHNMSNLNGSINTASSCYDAHTSCHLGNLLC